jgi:hypothetical protein
LFFVAEFGGFPFRIVANNGVCAQLPNQFIVALVTGFFPVTFQ